MRIEAAGAPLIGEIRVPGSKSLSTRALILAVISPRPVVLRDLLMAEDTERLLGAINAMGCCASRLFGSDWRIDGRGLKLGETLARINLGDGGAPTRFALALAALRTGDTIIDGSARMRERPIQDGVRLLRELGVTIEALEDEGRLPLRVRGGAFEARSDDERPEIAIGATASSQFISGLMLVAPAMAAGLRLRFVEAPTSASYLALSIDALRAFGAKVTLNGAAPRVARMPEGAADRAAGGADPHLVELAPLPTRGSVIDISPGLDPPSSWDVPVDASSAVVWVAAAAMAPGSRVTLPGLCRDAQPDLGAIDAIASMGASLEWSDEGLTVSHGPLHGVDLDAGPWPDGALAVAAVAAVASGPTRLRSLGTLRVKESDRLASIAQEFGRLGITVMVEGDDLVIEPDLSRPTPEMPTVETHNDHRIAMVTTLLGLARRGVEVLDPGCVAKSYPGFWRHLKAVHPAGHTIAV